MTILRTRTLAGLVAILLLGGCGSSTRLPATQTGNGAPPEFSLVTDIPIPGGASMDNDRSLILSDRDRWTGRVVLKTWKAANEATAFYQSQMPAFGWEPVMSVTSDISVLSYIRGDRAATIQVEKSSLWGATVSVTVAPRQSGATPAPAGYGGPAPRHDPMR